MYSSTARYPILDFKTRNSIGGKKAQNCENVDLKYTQD